MEETELAELPEKRFTPRFWAACSAWKLPDGRHDVGGYHVVKDRKMLVIHSPLNKSAEPNQMAYTQIVVYPRPEHFKAFVAAVKSVAQGGPADANPGGVGAVGVAYLNAERPFLVLSFAQAQYASNPVRKKYKGTALPRSLATRYAGWRYRALCAALRLAVKEGLPLVVPRKLFESFSAEKNGMLPNNLLPDLRRAAKSLGSELDEGGSRVIFYPKNSNSGGI